MFVCLSWCLVCVYDLAQVADAEAKGSGVTWAGVHVVANEQDDLKELGKVIALDQLLARCSHGHDVRLHVIYLLFKLQPEQDGVEPRLQTFHRTYLQHRDRQTEREKICEATISHRSYSCSLPLANIRWHHPILQHFFFSSVILNLTLKKYRPKNPCKLTHRKNLLLSLARTLKTSEERDSVPWVLCKQKLLQINTNLNQQMNRLTVIVNVVLM